MATVCWKPEGKNKTTSAAPGAVSSCSQQVSRLETNGLCRSESLHWDKQDSVGSPGMLTLNAAHRQDFRTVTTACSSPLPGERPEGPGENSGRAKAEAQTPQGPPGSRPSAWALAVRSRQTWLLLVLETRVTEPVGTERCCHIRRASPTDGMGPLPAHAISKCILTSPGNRRPHNSTIEA